MYRNNFFNMGGSKANQHQQLLDNPFGDEEDFPQVYAEEQIQPKSQI